MKISSGQKFLVIFTLFWIFVILIVGMMNLEISELAGGAVFVTVIILLGVIVSCCRGVWKDQEEINQYLTETYQSPERVEEDYSEYRGLPIGRPIPGVTKSLVRVEPDSEQDASVKVLRGGEFIGNRMRFKVKVLNNSGYLIADITVFLLTFPHDAMKFVGDQDHAFFSKIEPGGFRSPTFDFLPTQDCVRGEIVAGVSYIDMLGNPHTLNTKPFVIRSVCDLLLPHSISPENFELKLKELDCGEIAFKIDEWTPKEMFEKALRIVNESNFFEVSSEFEETDSIAYAKIVGFARGKYTGKEVGVQIDITGPVGVNGASCIVRVSGEDQAMIVPAIDDLRERLSAWLCPICSSPLSLDRVEDLRDGKVVECPFCKVTIGR